MYKCVSPFVKCVAKQNPAFGVDPVLIPTNRGSFSRSLFVFVQETSRSFFIAFPVNLFVFAADIYIELVAGSSTAITDDDA